MAALIMAVLTMTVTDYTYTMAIQARHDFMTSALVNAIDKRGEAMLTMTAASPCCYSPCCDSTYYDDIDYGSAYYGYTYYGYTYYGKALWSSRASQWTAHVSRSTLARRAHSWCSPPTVSCMRCERSGLRYVACRPLRPTPSPNPNP